jgi:ribosomal protein S8
MSVNHYLINLRLQTAKSCKEISNCNRSVTQWMISSSGKKELKILKLLSRQDFIRESLRVNYTMGCAALVILRSPDYRAKRGQLLSEAKC